MAWSEWLCWLHEGLFISQDFVLSAKSLSWLHEGVKLRQDPQKSLARPIAPHLKPDGVVRL